MWVEHKRKREKGEKGGSKDNMSFYFLLVKLISANPPNELKRKI